jgi:hypothetical protein
VTDPGLPVRTPEDRILAVCQWLAVAMFVGIAFEGLLTVFWVLIRYGWSK